ncbi:hypothetical protein Nepgr_030308 [Nepenthes gracilis]|uniref:Uncharacterized protein n=1 Tax=Nepenthes gracilis TaxID=150966 RepID=A0AAD3TF33_NEPGR|nr:hypothetical protein Nepgr_030308 [Nepenthes gracilis]
MQNAVVNPRHTWLGLRYLSSWKEEEEQRRMESSEASRLPFPPQRQETRPGKEHAMGPIPQAINPDYKPSSKLSGKVALVTGGDSGIGRALCVCFACKGASVAFTYVKGQKEKDSNDTLRMLMHAKLENADNPITIAAVLGCDQSCRKVVDEVVNRFGRIDILVNNAAEQHLTKTVEDITEERLERTFKTNIFSHFFMSRHAIKHMREGGCIINSASVAAYSSDLGPLDYSDSKGAIMAFTRALVLQLVEKGIWVNGVAPGYVWTPLPAASLGEGMASSFGSNVPMKRAAQPYEIAPSYVFLACNRCSSYYTGRFLHPNGGIIVDT